VVRVLHRPFLQVRRDTDVVVRSQDQACALPLEEVPDGLDLLRRRLLFRHQVIQPEDQQCVGIRQDSFVERQLATGVIDALEHRHRMRGHLADHVLEQLPGPEKQLERSGDPLLEHQAIGVLRRFKLRPPDAAHLVHGREAIVELCDVAVRLARIAPGDVHADAALPGRVLARHVNLVVRAG
jgi:hypothetical protein